ncbi:MAG TPA: monovalent cation/H(+) antiporter subunit G [Burkholderiaceae bacterium]|nr:monovalent cation/H(+) antiporter subunit G [Burkholderiaceae bacterium]
MTAALIGALLAVAVLAAWLAVAGLVAVRGPYGRMHFASLAAVAVPVPIALAALIGEPLGPFGWRALAIAALSVVVGALSAHAIARAAFLRERIDQRQRSDADRQRQVRREDAERR